ncbi:MAG: hypothetical protein ACOY93_19150 [Bacillota bacterium]
MKRNRWGVGLLAAGVLLAGCGAAPASGVEGLIQQVRRDVKASVQLIARQPLKDGGEIGIFAYRKGSLCGAGMVDVAAGSTVSQEGECSGPISAGQSSGEGLTVVYGYLPPVEVGRIVLRWEDGSEAEAMLGEAAFYYVAEGPDLPAGQVSLTAYDRQGKVLHQGPAPGGHSHGH